MPRLFRMFRPLRPLVLGLLCLTLSLSLAACASSPVKPPPQLLLSSISDPKTFNCVIANDSASSEVCGFLYEGLLTLNGTTGDLEPQLAESWQVLDNGQRIVFKLRPGLKWSDGQPLSADDVEFTFRELYFNERVPSGTRDVLRVGDAGSLPEVRKLDELRVEFRLPEPFSPFLRIMGVSILPAHILRPTVTKQGPDGTPHFNTTWGIDADVTQIVSNGAYTLAEYRPAERIAFVRNSHYRKSGQPYIERVVLNIVESQDTSLLQFRSRDLDLLDLRAEDFQLLKREEQRDDFKVYDLGPASSRFFLMFNQSQGRSPKTNQPFVNPVHSRWFNDVVFRRAVAYAIDRQAIINNVFRGLGQPQNSPINVQSPFYLSPQQGLTVYDYNPQKAKELLLQAGYRYNSQNQLLDAEGHPVRFTLSTNAGNKQREATGTLIQNDLAQIGIQVDFVPLEFSLLVGKLTNTRNWEAIILSLAGGTADPNNGSNTWRSTGSLHAFNQGPQPGEAPLPGRVVTDWERRIDQLFIAGTREFDLTKRQAIYNEFQHIAQEQLPFIHLVNPLSLSAARNRLENLRVGVLGSLLWNLEELRLGE